MSITEWTYRKITGKGDSGKLDIGKLVAAYVIVNVIAAGVRIGGYYVTKEISGEEQAKCVARSEVNKGDNDLITTAYRLILPGRYFTSKILSK